MKEITILDHGNDKYTINCNTNVLGRRYDNLSEKISIIKPEVEKDSICVMVVTYGNNVIDHIIVEDEPIDITSNLSQYETVKIGFSFTKPNGYIKGSEVKQFMFLQAPKPDDFIPVEPEQKRSIELLQKYGFVDAELNNNTIIFRNASGDTVKEIHLSGFVQEQADWNEEDSKSETYIKNKPTKLSQFENDIDLQISDATTTNKGVILIATDEDVTTGTDETKAITPKQLKENIKNLQDQIGYISVMLSSVVTVSEV